MPHEVSRSGPQTWNIALNLEHWDTCFLGKPLLIWLLPSMSCKLEGEKERFALALFKVLSDQVK
jgi:hypothetical protein